MKQADPPFGMFKGRNFLTPNVLEYFQLTVGYAELSEGRGLSNQPIFGVTVSSDAPLGYKSKVFESKREAMLYIRELSDTTEEN